jgi:hypothetical protein
MIRDGDVGVSPGTSVTGAVTFDNGKVVDDSADFAAGVLTAHAAAMREPSEPMDIEIGGKMFTPGTYRSHRDQLRPWHCGHFER